jgi:DNA-binding CsgD family transcriptional regulator
MELLRDSAAMLAQGEDRLEHARSLVELGAALRRHGHLSDARKPLNEGLVMARRCGGVALAGRAHDELTATGAHPRKTLRSGIDALTASELRVCQMAGEGMTNKGIAQALFLTVHTVETHLHRSYKKLDLSSRKELARALQSG